MELHEAFFTLHRDLPREGPGDRASLEWALEPLALPEAGRILDAGCGPGADIDGLLASMPHARVVAVDTHAPFVERVRTRFAANDRVTAMVKSMTDVDGRFDLVWCAGAMYFLGLAAGLAEFESRLEPGGHLVVSHPAWFATSPSPRARAFWEGEDATITTLEELAEAVERAGLRVRAIRRLPDPAWEAYYSPMEARIAALRPHASPALTAVLDEGQRELETWRAVREETGYAQVVASKPSR